MSRSRTASSSSLAAELAEEIGLIPEIGEWVLRTACAEAAKWPETVSIAVNLSPIQFKSHALPSTVRAALAESDLDPKRLELEITEGVFLSNDDHIHDMIHGLKDIGVKLALDDFGTGYSSLSYLLGFRSTRSRSTRASSAARRIPKAGMQR